MPSPEKEKGRWKSETPGLASDSGFGTNGKREEGAREKPHDESPAHDYAACNRCEVRSSDRVADLPTQGESHVDPPTPDNEVWTIVTQEEDRHHGPGREPPHRERERKEDGRRPDGRPEELIPEGSEGTPQRIPEAANHVGRLAVQLQADHSPHGESGQIRVRVEMLGSPGSPILCVGSRWKLLQHGGHGPRHPRTEHRPRIP